MTLKHAKVSAAGAPADPAKVGGDDWNADHIVDTTGATLEAATSNPATPAADKLVFFAKKIAGAIMACFTDPDGRTHAVQPFLGQRKIAYWSPIGNTNSLTGTVFGMLSPASVGTLTSRSVATTRLFTALRRIGIVSAATAGSRALFYNNDVLQWWRGNIAGAGGFRYVARFGCSDAATVAGARSFVGLSASSAVCNGLDPSSSTNLIGIGSDAADGNLQIIHNDGTGTATKVNLGANFPDHTLSVDAYELVLYAAPNAASVTYQVTRLNTGDTASGTLSTDLPASTQLLQPIFVRGNNATALAVGLDVMSLYIETEV
jgi:hypothetical protein